MKIHVRKPRKVAGILRVNGDKSITHRAMMIGALAHGVTRIRGFSKGNDCRSTFECLRTLGAAIEWSDDTLIIEGQGVQGLREPSDVLDCGNSGTTMRLLTGLLAGQEFNSVLTGDSSLRTRPMNRVIDPLRLMNGVISSRSGGLAPLAIQGSCLRAIDYTLPVASAQVKSALLLAGLQASGATTIREPVQSRDHTERMLEAFGCRLQHDNGSITMPAVRSLSGRDMHMPGDISSAAFFLVLATIVPKSTLTVRGVGMNPTRTGVLDALRSMGAAIEVTHYREENNEPVADLTVICKPLHGLIIDGTMVPRLIDELPVLAVAATQAQGTSEIRGARELRIKETDRIQAICQGLRDMGAVIDEHDDGFVIHGPCDLHATQCESKHDHRIAMALTIAGLVAKGETVIHDTACIAISFPEFTDVLQRMCGNEAFDISE
jgi:3-phosphoshikimate 1-carboxyvinyltransferase